jgi:hypothetical protein
MWHRTFARLREKAVAADIIADVHLGARLMKIARRVQQRQCRTP